MPKFNLSHYHDRVEKLYQAINVLISQHRKWVAVRTKDSFLAVQDTLFLDAVLIELSLIMRAIETGTFDEVDKAHRAANERIRALRAPVKPYVPEAAE
jgi:hypothetical protein